MYISIYIYIIRYRFRIFKIFFQDNVQTCPKSMFFVEKRYLEIDNTAITNSTINNLIPAQRLFSFHV